MPIPLPPPDNSGGFMLIKYTDGVIVHRMRVHVRAFNADSTGSYVTPPVGGEASVAATFTAVATILAGFLHTTFTISLDAVFQNAAGVLTEIFTVTPPATVAGSVAAATGPLEAFQSFNFRSLPLTGVAGSGGHRYRHFILSGGGWAFAAAASITANAAGTTLQQWVNQFTKSTTGIVAHDGGLLAAPARTTYGLNKKLRRRAGDA